MARPPPTSQLQTNKRSLQAVRNPGLHFVFCPCDRISTQLHGLRKLALGHPAIDCRTAKPDAMLNFGQANEPRHPPGFGRSLSISSPTMASLGTGKDIAKQRILAFELVDVVGEQAGDAVRGPLGPARLHIVNLVAQDTLER